MEKGISEIIGRGETDGGKGVEVYRALRSLLCSTCGADIAEGSLFTRRKVKGIGLRIMPQCPECAPFTAQPDRKERSQLLRALLAQATADSRETSARVSDKSGERGREDEKDLKEEVRRRLGPALERGRKGRG